MKSPHDDPRTLLKEHALSEDLDPENPRRRFRRWGCAALSILFLLASLTVYLLCIHVPPLRISEETTRITGPLTSDGRIDFFKALEEKVYPPELATDENGYRHFVRVFGYFDTPSKFYREQIYKKLNLDIRHAPTGTFPDDLRDVLKRLYPDQSHEELMKTERLFGKPWTDEEHPEIASWLDEAGPALDEIAGMVRKPVFFSPYVPDEESFRTDKPFCLYDLMLPEVGMVQSLSGAYQARANFRIARGDVDGAVDDMISLLHLGRKHGREMFLVLCWIGLSSEDAALSVPMTATMEQALDVHATNRFMAEWDRLPPVSELETVWEVERLSALSAMQAYLGGDKNVLDEHDELNALGEYRWRCDQNVAYRQLNELFDQALEEKDQNTFDVNSFLKTDEFIRNLLTPSRRGKVFGILTAVLTEPDIKMAANRFNRTACARNMKFLTLALLLYKAEHDEFPREDWVEKIKPYLGDKADEYFRCPGGKAGQGESDYALVLYNESVSDGKLPLLVELEQAESYENATVDPHAWLVEVDEKHSVGGFGSRHGELIVVGLHNGAVVNITESDFMSEYHLPLRRHLIENGYAETPLDEGKP